MQAIVEFELDRSSSWFLKNTTCGITIISQKGQLVDNRINLFCRDVKHVFLKSNYLGPSSFNHSFKTTNLRVYLRCLMVDFFGCNE